MANQQIIERLKAIATKASELTLENSTLKNQVDLLMSELESLKKINDIQKNSIETLEQKNKFTNIASVVSNLSEQEKGEVKKSISTQIREINKCLKLLKN